MVHVYRPTPAPVDVPVLALPIGAIDSMETS